MKARMCKMHEKKVIKPALFYPSVRVELSLEKTAILSACNWKMYLA